MEISRKEIQAVSCIKTNPKYFYKYATNQSKVRVEVGPLKDLDGHTTDVPEEIVEILRLQYEGVFSQPHSDKIIDSPTNFFKEVPMPNLTDIEFTTNDIETAIKEISISAAAGPDQFPAALLKNCAAELSAPLHIFYRNSLDSRYIP